MMSVLLLVLPLIGAVLVALAPTARAKWIALITTGVTFLVSVVFAMQFEHWSDGGFYNLSDFDLGSGPSELIAATFSGKSDEQRCIF